jgi:hypothetical protein
MEVSLQRNYLELLALILAHGITMMHILENWFSQSSTPGIERKKPIPASLIGQLPRWLERAVVARPK